MWAQSVNCMLLAIVDSSVFRSISHWVTRTCYSNWSGCKTPHPLHLRADPVPRWTGDEGELPQKSAERTDETVQLSKNTASKPESEPAVDKEAELPARLHDLLLPE